MKNFVSLFFFVLGFLFISSPGVLAVEERASRVKFEALFKSCIEEGKTDQKCKEMAVAQVKSDNRKSDRDDNADDIDASDAEVSTRVTSPGVSNIQCGAVLDKAKTEDLASGINQVNQDIDVDRNGSEAVAYLRVSACEGFFGKEFPGKLPQTYNQEQQVRLCTFYKAVYCVSEGQSAGSPEVKDNAACFSNSKVPVRLDRFLHGCFGVASAAQYNSDLKSGDTFYEEGGGECERPEDYTLDYKACKKAIGAVVYGSLSSQLGSMGVDVNNQVQKQKIKEGAFGPGPAGTSNDTQVKALNAQKKSFDEDAKAHTAKAGIETAKAGVILGITTVYPVRKHLRSKPDKFGMQEEWGDALFRLTAGDKHLRKKLFANQAVKSKAKEIGMQSVMGAIYNGLVAALHKKRAKAVAGVEQALKDSTVNNPISGFQPTATYCQQNPTVPACSKGGNLKPMHGKPSISFSGFGAQGGGNINARNGSLASDNGVNNIAKKVDPAFVEQLDDIVGGDNNSTGSDDFDKIAAATGGSGGGSGGGGGGGGGSAGGGGGAAGGGGGDGVKRKAAKQVLGGKVSGAYTPGSNMKFSQGRSRRKKVKDGNPFANMFKTKRKRGIASQDDSKLLGKDIKLFKALSDRYSDLNKNGRLAKTNE